jgi:heme/copper-type cytochrome/quinol oxidase subunit 3
VTIALGLAFLSGQVSDYVEMVRKGVALGTNLFTTMFFTLTGFHGIHVLVGLVALLVILTLTWRGQLRGRHAHALRTVGYYWHFVDVVWIAVFSVIYLRGTL